MLKALVSLLSLLGKRDHFVTSAGLRALLEADRQSPAATRVPVPQVPRDARPEPIKASAPEAGTCAH